MRVHLSAAGALAASGLVLATGAAFLMWPEGVSPASAHAAGGGSAVTVTGAYVREPASPDVAAGYFTVHNNGGSVETLTGVASNVSAETSTHTSNGGSMAPLAAPQIPAGGTLRFTAGGNHVMMMKPKPLKAGDHVLFTLYFAQGPAVTVDAPVIAIADAAPAS